MARHREHGTVDDMTVAERTPSVAPLPPELAALDFEPRVDEDLVTLAHEEVALRATLARALRQVSEAEWSYVAAESESERRLWRERARIAERTAARATVDLHAVLQAREDVIRTFGA